MVQSIVLTMIVKNEARIIERTLSAIKPYVDAWVVADTGSTDGTQEIVRRVLADLPGALYERPWRDFAHNRSEVLSLAASLYPDGYALILDADDRLEFPADFVWPELTLDSYRLQIRLQDLVYQRSNLLRLARGWRYTGVVHETPATLDGGSASSGALADPIYHCGIGVSARSQDPAKYAKDAALLQADLERNPGQSRTVFYLAQSLRDAGFLAEALRRYEERACLGGWAEEVFVSRLEAAKLRERLGQPYRKVKRAYLVAWESRPTRAEPLCELARYCRLNERYESGYRYARRASSIPMPQDSLFVQSDIYSWRLRDELALAAHYSGRHQEAVAVIDGLVKDRPDDARLSTNRASILATRVLSPAMVRFNSAIC